MDSLSRVLESLNERATAFLADGQSRLLYVPVDPDLAEGASQLLLGLEWHPENRRAFLSLSTACAAKDARWLERARELHAEYEQQREAYEQEAISLPVLEQPDESQEPLAAFAGLLKRIVDVFTGDDPGTDGIVLLLSPGGTAGLPKTFANEIAQLASAVPLAGVRWIWLDPIPVETANRLDVAELGAFASECPCHVDPERQLAESDALIASMAAAVASGRGMPGCAGPKVAPPPHPSDPPRPSPGNTAPYVVPLLGAVQKMRARDLAAAVPLLLEASRLCTEAGSSVEAIEIELLLATTLAQQGIEQRTGLQEALPVFDAAADRAHKAKLPVQEARTALILAAFANLAGDRSLATTALRQAMALANAAELPEMEVQALLMLGDLSLRAKPKRPIQEVSATIDLGTLVDESVETEQLTRRAGELAAICRERGLESLAERVAAFGKDA